LGIELPPVRATEKENFASGCVPRDDNSQIKLTGARGELHRHRNHVRFDFERGPTTFDCVLTLEGRAEVADLTEPFCEAGDIDEQYQWLNADGKVSLLLSPIGRW